MDSQAPESFDRLLSRLSARLINSEPAETRSCFEEVLAALGRYIGAARCYIFEFHENRARMSNTHEWVGTGISSHRDELQDIAQDELPYFFQTMQENHRFRVNDVRTLPEEADAVRNEFEREGIMSILCIGLVVNNQLLGFLGCDIVSAPHEWTDEEIQGVGLVADMITNAMQRERTQKELLRVRDELENANIQLALQASRDGLTCIPNRRALNERLEQEMRRAKRSGSGLAVLMIDIDFFKAYNDHYGHLAGDRVIRMVASTLEGALQRRTEFIARYGGEEFAVVLAVDSQQEAEQTANSLLQAVISLRIAHDYSDAHEYMTISIGGFFDRPAGDDAIEQSVHHFLTQADRAVYQAKSSGRNQVCFA